MSPGVLMVTGAYYPEISGGGLQCRQLIQALQGRAQCTVVTTSADPTLPKCSEVDGVPVYRLFVEPHHPLSKLSAAVELTAAMLRMRSQFQVVHLHGFSQKSLLVILLARLLGKKILLKVTSAGDDDPMSMRRRGRFTFWCYTQADRFVGVSPRLQELYAQSGLPRDKFRLIANGVDLQRFHPASQEERRRIRQALGLPPERTLLLFVGFFSREKHPEVLFEAWARLRTNGLPQAGLVFIGSHRSRYMEIDPTLAQTIQMQAARLGIAQDLVFVERTHQIEAYYRAADIFVLPSGREGLPNALLEAMASGLPCVTARLPGVTDAMIEEGINGLLVPPGDVDRLSDVLRALIEDPARREALGRRARETVVTRYAIADSAARYLEEYRQLCQLGPDGNGRVRRWTASSFGYLWGRSRTLPAIDGAAQPYHLDRMMQRLSLDPPQGMILDAGCGEGRDLAHQARRPGVEVIGVEVSDEGCRISRARSMRLPVAHVVQADLQQLPFEANRFDFVYSYGVLHHLAAPQEGLRELVRVLKPGARIALYLYEDFSERAVGWRWLLKLANQLRRLTIHLPHRVLYGLCQAASPAVYMLFTVPARMLRHVPGLRSLGLSMPFRHGTGPFSLAGDLYDRFSAPVEWRYSRAQALALVKQMGLEAVVIAQERGWMVAARKPCAA